MTTASFDYAAAMRSRLSRCGWVSCLTAVDDEGEFEDDTVGFAGAWQGNAGPSSNVSLRFQDGAVCMSGETAQVQNEDYTTYFGAEATFSLCETNSELAPVRPGCG